MERRADLAERLRRMDLDVFGLQEVTPDQAAYLCGELPDFAYVGEFRNADRASGEASLSCRMLILIYLLLEY